jgi:hypothetical protein
MRQCCKTFLSRNYQVIISLSSAIVMTNRKNPLAIEAYLALIQLGLAPSELTRLSTDMSVPEWLDTLLVGHSSSNKQDFASKKEN